ncbi:hypothetical protein MSAN_02382200 [Mycena sanguinolenta]|uniref:Uncharacterized protein n=1 Tax=Mycena sanguinolenta TaxID=230812 RepID=A0A8H7CE33_9AGAR|nr:hypothetical protein MSAN_02382200 [Mycena sanguinolenta]
MLVPRANQTFKALYHAALGDCLGLCCSISTFFPSTRSTRSSPTICSPLDIRYFSAAAAWDSFHRALTCQRLKLTRDGATLLPPFVVRAEMEAAISAHEIMHGSRVPFYLSVSWSLMANTTELPNAFTPLAFVPPTLANALEVSRYLYAATLGAYVWDIGLNLGNDYVLLFKHRVRFPTIMYFMSRAFTLAYILTSFIFLVAPVKNCNALAVGLDVCFVLSQTSTALLFFLRVTAVWHPSKIAYAIFSILCMAVLGAGITAPLGIPAAQIGPTKQCIITAVPANTELAVIMPLINDTAVFLAITYRVLAHTVVANSSMARFRVFLGGKGLSTLSQALLQTGQHFYLIAVVTHIVVLVMLKLPHLSEVYNVMLAIPAISLVNAMACLVFRRIKFGLIAPDGTSNISITVDFHATANPRSFSLPIHHTDSTTAGSGSNTAFPLDVRARREVDKLEDGAEAYACEEISKPRDLV